MMEGVILEAEDVIALEIEDMIDVGEFARMTREGVMTLELEEEELAGAMTWLLLDLVHLPS